MTSMNIVPMTKVTKSDNKSDDKSDDNEDFTISSSNGGGEFKFLHLVNGIVS